MGDEVRPMRRCSNRFMVGAIGAAALALMGGCGTEQTPGGNVTGSAASTPASALTTDALLTAALMPAWNGAMGWVEDPGPTATGVLTVCVLPSAESLGAIQVLEREFRAAGLQDAGTTADPTWPPSYGVDQVARFTDEESAAAAVDAWEGAIRDCRAPSTGTGSPDSSQIGDLATGSTWTAAAPDTSAACSECLRFEFIGVASKGASTTLVGFAITGQDANYEGDPLAAAMSASLARLP